VKIQNASLEDRLRLLTQELSVYKSIDVYHSSLHGELISYRNEKTKSKSQNDFLSNTEEKKDFKSTMNSSREFVFTRNDQTIFTTLSDSGFEENNNQFMRSELMLNDQSLDYNEQKEFGESFNSSSNSRHKRNNSDNNLNIDFNSHDYSPRINGQISSNKFSPDNKFVSNVTRADRVLAREKSIRDKIIRERQFRTDCLSSSPRKNNLKIISKNRFVSSTVQVSPPRSKDSGGSRNSEKIDLPLYRPMKNDFERARKMLAK
jgi:hypothetical protein